MSGPEAPVETVVTGRGAIWMASQVHDELIAHEAATIATPLVQTTPAATWTYAHGLGLCPDIVVLVDSAPDQRVYPDVTYPDLDTAVITFPTAETGTAFAR